MKKFIFLDFDGVMDMSHHCNWLYHEGMPKQINMGRSLIHINLMLHPNFAEPYFDRDCNLPAEEQDEETAANLLKSLREAIDAWMKENPDGLEL